MNGNNKIVNKTMLSLPISPLLKTSKRYLQNQVEVQLLEEIGKMHANEANNHALALEMINDK
jgi:hypothetical protein